MKRTYLIPILAVLLASSFVVSGTAPSTLEKTRNADSPTVENPVQPGDDLVQQARGNAKDLRADLPDEAAATQAGRFASKAGAGLNRAEKATGRWGKLLAYRGSAVHARVAVAKRQAADGNLTGADVRQSLRQQRDRLQRLKDRVDYDCRSMARCVVVAGEIETSLASAQNWLDQVPEVLNRSSLSEAEQLAYAAGALEAAEGNLADAASLERKYRSRLTGGDVAASLDERYRSIHDAVEQRLRSSSYGDDVYASHLTWKAEGRLDRAERRYEAGLTAAAVDDLLTAYQFLEATDEAADIASPELQQSNLSDERLLLAKRDAVSALDAALTDASDLETTILEGASLQIGSGDDKVEWVMEAPDPQARQQAYAHYVVAKSFAESADDAASLLTDD